MFNMLVTRLKESEWKFVGKKKVARNERKITQNECD